MIGEIVERSEAGSSGVITSIRMSYNDDEMRHRQSTSISISVVPFSRRRCSLFGCLYYKKTAANPTQDSRTRRPRFYTAG
jgi:hypothetical protein